MDDSLISLSLANARDEICAGRLSPLELTKAYLARIEALNPAVNAYLHVAAEAAIHDARIATEAVAQGKPLGLLHGIPIGVKDLYDVRGMPTTAGSILLKDKMAADDAFIIERLRRAGAIFLGKLNMHEWALGVTTTNPHFGACHNPWNLEYISGGSSGGSGAALAAGMCLGSVGTDTGGSIRIPASLCGVVGLKPTYGRLSLSGVVPLSFSQDHAGPMARTVEDVALLLAVVAGYDAEDPSSVDHEVEDFASAVSTLHIPLPFRVGFPNELFLGGNDPETRAAVEKAVSIIPDLGCEVREVSFEGYETAMDASARILLAEAAAYHSGRIHNHPDKIGADVLERLRQGLEVTGTEYALARKIQVQWQRKMSKVFESVDLMVLPATPQPATSIAESEAVPLARGRLTRFMRLFNLTGIPALVLPCGFTRSGLPIGLQIAGPAWSEARLLQLAHAYQEATDWHHQRPPL
ncbi:MAG: amidase [Acidobacteriia bacterium]|nr:amidase [Terriglobia bacterium]